MDKTILVVDDDAELRQLLREYFSERGYAVLLADGGAQMYERLKDNHVDLIILDLMLPGEDGLSLCRQLSTTSSVPILMLTARGDEMDRIVGLEMGADDYLHKPFIPRELLARVKNILRRTGEGRDEQRAARALYFSGWTLDIDARHLVDSAGVVVARVARRGYRTVLVAHLDADVAAAAALHRNDKRGACVANAVGREF